MRRYFQFAAGVTVMLGPAAFTASFAIYTALQLQAELDRYRHVFVTIPFGADEIPAFVLMVALSIAASILGMKLIDRSRYPDQDGPISIVGSGYLGASARTKRESK